MLLRLGGETATKSFFNSTGCAGSLFRMPVTTALHADEVVKSSMKEQGLTQVALA